LWPALVFLRGELSGARDGGANSGITSNPGMTPKIAQIERRKADIRESFVAVQIVDEPTTSTWR
jgi:hypothetical protein